MATDPRKKKYKSASKRHPGRMTGLAVLHEDRDILVVNKEPGLLTIATDAVCERTAYALLTDYVRKGVAKSRERVFIVHRLDRETSGVLVFARTPDAKRFLQGNWDAAEKRYVAVVHGHLEKAEGEICSYLAENAALRVYSTPHADKGKLAHTGYRVLQRSGPYSILSVQLFTGRKHQIRVHLAEQGHPVVGDRKYGKAGDSHKLLALHAQTLTILHPYSGERMCFTAPEPPHIARWLRVQGCKEDGQDSRT
jgi:RluA family pseudouridine synthase